jgi:CheY-like chemotaxis protein
MAANPWIILLAEDDPDHAELIREGFEELTVTTDIRHVLDGEEALDYLRRRRTFEDPETSPRPHLILLDLRMPRIDGLDVLKEIKADKDLHTIPVVVLTTSDADRDIRKAYDYSTNSYLLKPLSFGEFEDLIKQISDYWLRWNVQLDSEDLG